MTDNTAPKVTDEQARLLAAHAMYVQGGYSTPDIEKAKAENGGPVDFDKIRAEVMEAMASAPAADEEAEAALAEGLAPMPADLVPLRDEKLSIDQQVDELQARKKEIQEIFAQRLEGDGLQGYTLLGKVRARVSHGTRHAVDSKKLKAEMPHIWAKFLKVTKYRTVSVS